jgi:hypothetical protein
MMLRWRHLGEQTQPIHSSKQMTRKSHARTTTGRSQVVALAVLLACLVGLGLGGCGGSSSSTSSSTTSAESGGSSEATSASFIAAADEICDASRKEVEDLSAQRTKLTKELATSPSADAAKQMQDVLDQMAAAKQKATKQLQALDQPAPGAADEYYAAREATAEATQASADAFGEYAKLLNNASVAAVSDAEKTETAAVAKEVNSAQDVGFQSCGASAEASK